MSASNAEQVRDVIRRFFDAADRGDLAAFSELVTDDVAIHTPVPGIGNGRDAAIVLLTTLLNGVPDHRVEVHEIIVEGDSAACRHTHRGTHTGELLGVQPTGNHVEVTGIEMFRVEDGRVAEFFHLDDLLALLQQIGAVPTGAPEPVAAG